MNTAIPHLCEQRIAPAFLRVNETEKINVFVEQYVMYACRLLPTVRTRTKTSFSFFILHPAC